MSFRGKNTNSAVNSAGKPKFRGSARNSTGCGKLWALVMILSKVSRSVLGCAPSYLRDLCCPVSVLAARRVLRSAVRGVFLVPQARLAIMQRRAFSVVSPSAWNDLPFELRFLLMAHPSKFYISLKSFFFVRDWAGSASE